jgi:hypothetical protein
MSPGFRDAGRNVAPARQLCYRSVAFGSGQEIPRQARNKLLPIRDHCQWCSTAYAGRKFGRGSFRASRSGNGTCEGVCDPE